jgi:hypothetical protein
MQQKQRKAADKKQTRLSEVTETLQAAEEERQRLQKIVGNREYRDKEVSRAAGYIIRMMAKSADDGTGDAQNVIQGFRELTEQEHKNHEGKHFRDGVSTGISSGRLSNNKTDLK